MKLPAILLLTFALAAKADEDRTFVSPKDLLTKYSYAGSRIISGEPAQPGEFPWQVGVYYRRADGGLYFCGGSLINERYVATAAHCAAEASLFSLFFGGTRLNSNEDGTRTVEVDGEAAFIHPEYNPSNLNNDIALIRLPEPLELTDRISPIRLPLQGEILAVGSELTVSGWGVTETSSSIVDNLLFANVHSISNLQCAAVYGTSVIIDSTVCTQGNPVQSPCNGDSGGPLVSFDGPEPTLAGVISFIHRDGCSSGNPAGYVRIEAQLQFINEVLSQDPENPEEPPPENPEEPPQNPEEPPLDPEEPPQDPEEPPQDPEEPPLDPEEPPQDPEQPPQDPEEPPLDPEEPPQDPEQPPQDPEDPEQPPQDPEDPEQPPQDPEEPPQDPEQPPQDPEDPEQPPQDPEEPQPSLQLNLQVPQKPEKPPQAPEDPPQAPEEPPQGPEAPEQPPQQPENPPLEPEEPPKEPEGPPQAPEEPPQEPLLRVI